MCDQPKTYDAGRTLDVLTADAARAIAEEALERNAALCQLIERARLAIQTQAGCGRRQATMSLSKDVRSDDAATLARILAERGFRVSRTMLDLTVTW